MMITTVAPPPRARVYWFTGLSGAGKTTIANALHELLQARNVRSIVLDGDHLRNGLNSDLGFSTADRSENIRRTAEVAKLFVDTGVVVIACLISPLAKDRQRARSKFAADAFREVFIDTPLNIAELRDPKGLYARARRGELSDFTGIDSPYETPTAPEFHIETTKMTVLAAATWLADDCCAHSQR